MGFASGLVLGVVICAAIVFIGILYIMLEGMNHFH